MTLIEKKKLKNQLNLKKTNGVVLPDEDVTDRMKTVKGKICGAKSQDNGWTKLFTESSGTESFFQSKIYYTQ